MRFLHTSDWHLGRTIGQESLHDDQAHLLEQVFSAVVGHQVDVLIIAGDIFDRAAPRRETVALFSQFLARVYRETSAAIVAVAGNHDAPERVGFNAPLQDPRRVLIRGPLRDRPGPLILEDAFGQVAISALPFSEIFAAREAFGDPSLTRPAEVLAAQIAEARGYVPPGARWVIVSHAFVEGGAVTESERPLTQVGGIETVGSNVFEGAHYVALGHLHRAQAAGARHINYSGSWMGFGFDEADNPKTMSLVDLDGEGAVELRPLRFSPLRPMRVMTGDLSELLASASAAPDAARCLVKAVLTDEGALVDPIGQLRSVYPHVLQLERQQRAGLSRPAADRAAVDRRDPGALVASFLDVVRGEGPNDAEALILSEALAALTTED